MSTDDTPSADPTASLQTQFTAPQPLSRRERQAVLSRIQALMAYWNISVDELQQDGPLPTRAAPGPRPVKYRHPVSGETWDGEGPHPDWLRHALLKEGLRVEELRPAASDPSAVPPRPR